MTSRPFVNKVLRVIATLAAGAAIASLASAQATYPDKPIRILVGFAAGSGTDTIARRIGDSMGQAMKQPIIIENRPGAMTAIASEAVARAPADGYTLLLANNAGMSLAPGGLIGKVNYDPLKDFTPIGRIIFVNFLMVSNPKLNINTPAEMTAYFKANPSQAICGAGNATGKIFCEFYKKVTGLDIAVVSYKTSNEALSALVGGQIPMMFLDTLTAIPRMKQAQVKLLAYMGPQRNPVLPIVPSQVEAGLTGFPTIAGGWTGLYAPAGLPPAIMNKLNAELNAALARPAVRDYFTETGMEIVPTTPEEMARYARGDLEMWRKLIQDFKIGPEG